MNSLERDMGVLPPVSHDDGKGPQSDAPAPEPANDEHQETAKPDGTEVVKKKKKNRKKKKETTIAVQGGNGAGNVGKAQDPVKSLGEAGKLLSGHMDMVPAFMGPEEYEKMKHRLVDGAQGTVTRKLMGAAGMIPDFHQPAVQAAQVEKTVAKKADNDADEWTDAEKDAAWRKHMARGDYADSHVLDRVVPSDYNGDKTAQHTSPSSKVASPDRHHTSTPPSIDKPLIDEALKTKLLAELVDELYALPESVLPRKYKQAVSFALQDSYLCQKKENELDISPEKLAVNKSIERPPNGGIPSFLKPVEMALRKPLVAREINGRVVFVDDDSESDNAQRHTLSWDSFGDDSDLEVSPTFKFDQHPRHTIGHNNPIASPNFRFRSSPQLDNHSIHPNYLPALSIAHTEDKMGCSAEKPARLEGKDSRVKLVLEPKSALKVSQVPRNAAERKMATSFGIPTGDTSLAKKASDFDSSNKLSRAVEAPPAHNDAAMAKLLRSPHAPVRGTSLEREDANLRSVKKHPFAAGTSLPGSTADKMTTSSGITDRGTSLEKASDLDSENKLSCAATTGVGNAASMSGHYDTEEVDAPFEMDAGWRRMFMGDALITRMLDVQPDIAMFWENYSIVEMNAFCNDPPVLDRLMQAHLDFLVNQNLKKQEKASEEKVVPADSKKGGGKKRNGKKSGGRR